MKRISFIRGLVALGFAHSQSSFACDLTPAPHDLMLRDNTRQITVRLRPDKPVRADQALSFDIDTCGASPLTVTKFDAHMPAHRHGMNYAASITPLIDGRFRVRGVVLHMPGTWELVVDLQSAAGPAKLRLPIEVR